MAIKTRLSSAPLRVYWDILPEPAGGLSAGASLDIARQLAGLKVFFVTLSLSGGGRRDVLEITDALKGGGVRVILSVCDAASMPGEEVLSRADSLVLVPDDAGGLGAMLARLGGGFGLAGVTVAAVPARDSLDTLVETFSAAVDAGVRSFSLPNPNLAAKGADVSRFVLSDADRARLKGGLEGLMAPLGPGVKLAVHDLMIHGALELPGLGERVEYAGCQAGDALAYIDAAGRLYPCASLPVSLGDLKEKPFRELWQGAARASVRHGITPLPAECERCPDAPSCKGGCRGLAWCATGGYGRDPGCTAPAGGNKGN